MVPTITAFHEVGRGGRPRTVGRDGHNDRLDQREGVKGSGRLSGVFSIRSIPEYFSANFGMSFFFRAEVVRWKLAPGGGG